MQNGMYPSVIHKSYCRWQHYFLSMDLFSSSIFICGESVLYTLIGIRSPLVPVCNLYSHIFFDFFLFSFPINNNLTLWKLKSFDLITSNSCVSVWLAFHHHEHLLPYTRHLLASCEFPQYLQFMRVSLLLVHASS